MRRTRALVRRCAAALQGRPFRTLAACSAILACLSSAADRPPNPASSSAAAIGLPQRPVDQVHAERHLAEPDHLGRNAPARPQFGQMCATVRSSSHEWTASQRPQRAFKSSPCMWMTDAEPARSCRWAAFCVSKRKVSRRAWRASSRVLPERDAPRWASRRAGCAAADHRTRAPLRDRGEGLGGRELHWVELRPDLPRPCVVTKGTEAAPRLKCRRQ